MEISATKLIISNEYKSNLIICTKSQTPILIRGSFRKYKICTSVLQLEKTKLLMVIYGNSNSLESKMLYLRQSKETNVSSKE